MAPELDSWSTMAPEQEGAPAALVPNGSTGVSFACGKKKPLLLPPPLLLLLEYSVKKK